MYSHWRLCWPLYSINNIMIGCQKDRKKTVRGREGEGESEKRERREREGGREEGRVGERKTKKNIVAFSEKIFRKVTIPKYKLEADKNKL